MGTSGASSKTSHMGKSDELNRSMKNAKMFGIFEISGRFLKSVILDKSGKIIMDMK